MATDTIYFWKTGEHPYGAFSNWAATPFEAEGWKFATAEHYIMWRKATLFGDDHTAHRVLLAATPIEAKAFGRRVRGFDDDVWRMRRDGIAHDALLHKFTSSRQLCDLLLGTGGAVIAEASPVDTVWGIGIDAEAARSGVAWRGENVLGRALMRVRGVLRGGGAAAEGNSKQSGDKDE